MNFIQFPAQLHAGYNGTSEYGRAEIFPQAGAIDFSSEFIPLLPLAAPAQVDWMLGTKVVLSIPGEVYLSSPGLVRLVNVPKNTMQTLAPVFATNINIPAFIRTTGMHHRGRDTSAEIVYLSQKRLTLQITGAVPSEKRLYLSAEVDFLTLSSLELTVESQVLLRKGTSLLHCKIMPGSDENLIAHSAYLSRLEQLDFPE